MGNRRPCFAFLGGEPKAGRLSYSSTAPRKGIPITWQSSAGLDGQSVHREKWWVCKVARLAGFEPATYGLEVRCSIHLSYRRAMFASNMREFYA